MKNVIYKNRVPCKIWLLGGESTVYILTIIYEYKLLWLRWTVISQMVPLIKSPFFDGEHSSNERLKVVAKSEKIVANEYLAGYRSV